ncbi:hypothetical protein IJ847_00905 [Candidatus Saccharibacteria bacterium]|nr:hypothetical protein [Candidatus Saccharibacteria bacterium]
MKFLIANSSQDQKIAFLLDESGELFARDTIWEAEEDFEAAFGTQLRIGKVFSVADGEYFFFAAAVDDIKTYPEGWRLVDFAELKPDNCPDYETIVAAAEQLGY